jgi:hypothetical protein
MKRFMSDRVERERLLEITSPLRVTALDEVRRILSVTEPHDKHVARVMLSKPYPREIQPALDCLADMLWCYVNA